MIGLVRRRYMGSNKGIDENSYIQDRLVFQLDGINKGSNEGKWTDLKGGLVLSAAGTPVATNDGWVFDGSSRFYHSARFSTTSDYTLEVCGTFASGRPFISGSWSEGALCLYGNRFIQRKATCPHNLYTNTQMSASLNVDSCIMNNSASVAAGSTTSYNTGYSALTVGAFQNSNMLVGTINALRIYSRKLTEQEQRHNILVDSKRFNFSLT